jgi:hypothetical protein
MASFQQLLCSSRAKASLRLGRSYARDGRSPAGIQDPECNHHGYTQVNSTLQKGNVPEAVAELKAQPGQDFLVMCSASWSKL